MLHLMRSQKAQKILLIEFLPPYYSHIIWYHDFIWQNSEIIQFPSFGLFHISGGYWKPDFIFFFNLNLILSFFCESGQNCTFRKLLYLYNLLRELKGRGTKLKIVWYFCGKNEAFKMTEFFLITYVFFEIAKNIY